MLTAIEGIYENGQIILKENPAINERVKVFVMFTDEKAENTPIPQKRPSESLRGAWKAANTAEKKAIEHYFDTIRNEWERDI
jgi:hypothetical protein